MSLTIEMFIPMISETIADLSKENYNKIEEDGRLGRINIDDLKRVITEYGCEIIPLPDRAFNLAVSEPNVIKIYFIVLTGKVPTMHIKISLLGFLALYIIDVFFI
ncbi:DUF7668 domain-containing protein [Lysinibacillus xylanilyticus]|uniref:DUF7668 domain-containing protein n=1 Tax=Lysinibacillus xylanilyticus TaxID=582475 RepID=UPI003D0927D8